ncbi:MAG: glutamine-hydrolyzing carbamoyl-phosphate synthase small subunit, partial [Planctomycetota bacterium]
MTYPHIGNYGVNADDVESAGVAASALIVRDACDMPSNYRSQQSLGEFLKRHGIVGLANVDTRALVRRIRVHGAMTGVVSTTDLDDASLVAKAKQSPELVGVDYVKDVMAKESKGWTDGLHALASPADAVDGPKPKVVAIDFGMKWNIPRHLTDEGLDVTVVPGDSTAADVLAHEPDGVFLSNGPGDPRPLTYAVDTIKDLLGEVPVFGICLGHQLLGLACGGEIFKLKFGHRGANQPVLDKTTGKVEITSQNHGFALDADSLPDDVEVTHVNLNDDTVAGIRHKSHPAFGVQYHPEASAGPHDSRYLFRRFKDMLSASATT